MTCHTSTARRWLNDLGARYIIHDGRSMVIREDADRIITAYKAKLDARKANKEKAEAKKRKKAA